MGGWWCVRCHASHASRKESFLKTTQVGIPGSSFWMDSNQSSFVTGKQNPGTSPRLREPSCELLWKKRASTGELKGEIWEGLSKRDSFQVNTKFSPLAAGLEESHLEGRIPPIWEGNPAGFE